jgi:hypothetical protein
VDHLDKGEWGLLLAVALASLFAALLLRPFQLQLVRVLEGYWPDTRAASVLAAHMRASQAARKAELRARASLADPHTRKYLEEHLKRLERQTDECAAAHLKVARRWRAGPETRARLIDHARWYPAEERLLPTRLGNTLRSIEDNAGQRYGLSTVTIWPRLYPLLSDTLRQESQRARDDYDTAARLCAVLAVFSVVSAVLVIPNGGWWRLTPVLLASLVPVAYRAACQGARYYGLVVYTCFDLHRFDLLVRLRQPLPRRHRDEIRSNKELSTFLQSPLPGAELPVRYAPFEPASS